MFVLRGKRKGGADRVGVSRSIVLLCVCVCVCVCVFFFFFPPLVEWSRGMLQLERYIVFYSKMSKSIDCWLAVRFGERYDDGVA